jgi:DNA-binding LytR/AlgR family response regulator
VLTTGHEYLIRAPIKELLPQLDPQLFWEVHRGTVVRVEQIASVHRDEKLAVSRPYAHLFRAM